MNAQKIPHDALVHWVRTECSSPYCMMRKRGMTIRQRRIKFRGNSQKDIKITPALYNFDVDGKTRMEILIHVFIYVLYKHITKWELWNFTTYINALKPVVSVDFYQWGSSRLLTDMSPCWWSMKMTLLSLSLIATLTSFSTESSASTAETQFQQLLNFLNVVLLSLFLLSQCAFTVMPIFPLSSISFFYNPNSHPFSIKINARS